MTRMATSKNENLENRVLVYMPTGRDAELVCITLGNAGIEAEACGSAKELESNIKSGAGAVLLAEEALQNGTLEHLVESFERQPIWSDIPVVLFAINARNSEILLETVGTRLNATIVERPIRITMLVSAVRGALRAREKQYQTRDLLNQLEQADHQKDLFLATLSHELRTPLNSMLGWIQLLRAKDSRRQIDESHALAVIERNARAQSEMISDILFVSRVITGKLTLNLEPVDLLSVVKAAIDVVLPSIGAKEIELHTAFDSDANSVKADADRLQQVFLNLLSNAIKFTPVKGRIEVSIKNKDTKIEVEIRDSGQGIKPEFLPFVFERFRQADNSYTRQVGGLGLGLAIVRHLVELHGGEVGVQSEGDNRGAAFTVSLPIFVSPEIPTSLSKERNRRTFPETSDEKPLEGVRILLVEDDEDSCEMLKVMFEQSGIKITAVDSAAEAFEIIQQKPPDILISDVGLPGEDGYDLLRKIRQLTPAKGGLTPAIALTGYASLQDRSLAFQAGFQEHLSKPVDIEKLIQLVKGLLNRGKL